MEVFYGLFFAFYGFYLIPFVYFWIYRVFEHFCQRKDQICVKLLDFLSYILDRLELFFRFILLTAILILTLMVIIIMVILMSFFVLVVSFVYDFEIFGFSSGKNLYNVGFFWWIYDCALRFVKRICFLDGIV